LELTYFKFNEIIYKQKFDIPMSSSLSRIIKEIILQDLEKKALGLLSIGIPFYHNVTSKSRRFFCKFKGMRRKGMEGRIQ